MGFLPGVSVDVIDTVAEFDAVGGEVVVGVFGFPVAARHAEGVFDGAVGGCILVRPTRGLA